MQLYAYFLVTVDLDQFKGFKNISGFIKHLKKDTVHKKKQSLNEPSPPFDPSPLKEIKITGSPGTGNEIVSCKLQTWRV